MSITSAALASVCVAGLAGSVGAPMLSASTATPSGSPSLAYRSPGHSWVAATTTWHPDACLTLPATVALHLGAPCIHRIVLWHQARTLERDPLR